MSSNTLLITVTDVGGIDLETHAAEIMSIPLDNGETINAFIFTQFIETGKLTQMSFNTFPPYMIAVKNFANTQDRTDYLALPELAEYRAKATALVESLGGTCTFTNQLY